MNLIAFTNSLLKPSQISIEQTAGLENILGEFPYFHAAHFLHLNGLKNQNSFKYNNALKKTAAYSSDRSVLFDYITSYDFNFNPNDDNFDQEDELVSIKVNELEVVERNVDDSYETLAIGKPLQFDPSETYSFGEWLQISSVKPIQRGKNEMALEESSKKEVVNPSQSTVRNIDLIENFIASKPKINPSISDHNINIALDSITENENLMTETLAHVYLEQKKYKKAITAFTVLSLKYPEKSSFFANQIQAIKKLQEK